MRGSAFPHPVAAVLRSTLAAVLLLLALLAPHPAQAQYFSVGKGSFPLERYDIDYSSLADPSQRQGLLDELHYIPLEWASGSYLSLGGEVREQYWNQVSEAHALRTPVDDSYDLQRVAISGDLHFNSHLSAYGEIMRADSIGKITPSTTDETRGRLQQGFLQGEGSIGNLDVYGRVGRQEITLGSGRFVWINDSSNVRTTQDGARVRAVLAGGSLSGASVDLAITRPVTPTYTAFDDWNSHAGSFGSVYASEPFCSEQLHLDEYYYYRRAPAIQFGRLTGIDARNTVGGRLWGAFGPLKFDSDIAYQWGSYDATTITKSVSAFGTSSRVLYTFEGQPLQPGVQFQTSYFSGTNNPNGHSIGTFLAPFPRPTLINYAGLNTLENLVEAYPAVLINPLRSLTVRFGPQMLWRATGNDAVYISRTTPLAKTLGDNARYIGTDLTWTAQWVITPNINVFGEYLHELAGGAITGSGGHAARAGVLMLDFNF